MVCIRRWVWNAQRAIDTVAVLQRWPFRSVILVVARFTEVGCSEAAEQGYAATELAFPVDLRGAVLLTRCSASTNLFEQAVLAQQVLLLRLLLLCVCHLLLAVD